MEGFIKIEVHGDNLSVETRLSDVGISGKAALLDGLLQGLQVETDEELKMMLVMYKLVNNARKKGAE